MTDHEITRALQREDARERTATFTPHSRRRSRG